MLTERAMFDFGTDQNEKPCLREWDSVPRSSDYLFLESGWWCVNDHTGCLWNDGNNTCNHEGDSLSPLEDD